MFLGRKRCIRKSRIRIWIRLGKYVDILCRIPRNVDIYVGFQPNGLIPLKKFGEFKVLLKDKEELLMEVSRGRNVSCLKKHAWQRKIM